MNIKFCKKCKQEKAFYKNNNNGMCKDCWRSYMNEYNKNKPEKKRQYRINYKLKLLRQLLVKNSKVN